MVLFLRYVPDATRTPSPAPCPTPSTCLTVRDAPGAGSGQVACGGPRAHTTFVGKAPHSPLAEGCGAFRLAGGLGRCCHGRRGDRQALGLTQLSNAGRVEFGEGVGRPGDQAARGDAPVISEAAEVRHTPRRQTALPAADEGVRQIDRAANVRVGLAGYVHHRGDARADQVLDGVTLHPTALHFWS